MSKPRGHVPVLPCYHCGNRTPHREVFSHKTKLLFEHIDRKRYYEPYFFRTFACGTCGGLSLFGAFRFLKEQKEPRDPEKMTRLYPRGPDVIPRDHSVSPKDPVPVRVLQTYTEAWPLRILNPAAFANQIRCCLELVCEDKHASGKDLKKQLQFLASRGVFPPDLAQVADLVRRVGNIGSHAAQRDVDVWDAELVDDLFRLILSYVYVGPAHVRRMRERLGEDEPPSEKDVHEE